MCLDGLEVYLVGGAVRDALLGRPVHERDWVVVGATPEAMTERGFRPVGRDFPVFLHPETHEEYALARTERKSGRGYHGFTMHASPDVTLEADLARRDLTVNAMAQRPDGTLVDPFDGRADLEARQLRHVSPAFREDPVRILRLARFSARFAPLGFEPAAPTMALCRTMVDDGEVDHLVAERVWQELDKALAEPRPAAFFRVLRDCGALARLMPELDALFGAPRPEGDGDAGAHALAAVDAGASAGADPVVRFALLLQDLDTAPDPRAALARRRDAAQGVDALCDRLRVPNTPRELAAAVALYGRAAAAAPALAPEERLTLLERLDAVRRPERFAGVLEAVRIEAGLRGEDGSGPVDHLAACRAAVAPVTGGDFAARGYKGPQIAEAVRAEREARIAQLDGTAPGV